MTFTDDDLKRLKERMVSIKSVEGRDQFTFEHGYIDALLARLEAAEIIVREYIDDGNADSYIEAWRETAGKETE